MRKKLQIPKTRPENLIGRTVRLPDIMRCVRQAHEDQGWGPFNKERQEGEDFRFDGKAFKHYVRNVLGKDFNIRKVYFPAVYTGKVALAISRAGFDVFASDLSEYWTGQAIASGIRAERRSFDEIPNAAFDAVVAFEPFCVPSALKYLAIMRSITASTPYVEIDQQNAERRAYLLAEKRYFKKPPSSLWSLTKACDDFLRNLRKKKVMRLNYDESAWEQKLYGAKVMVHLVHDGNGLFMFRSVIPNESAKENASIDIDLIARLGDRPVGLSLSLKELSGILNTQIDRISDSLIRIGKMSEYLLTEGTLRSRDYIVDN